MSEASAEGALFEAAFRDAALGMALVGTDGSWLHINQALWLMFGFTTREELTAETPGFGPHAAAFLPDAEAQAALLEARVASQCFERRYVHREGQPLWACVTVSLARDGEQQPRFFVVQVQDISERHAREQESRLFFEQSLDLMAVASLEGTFTRLSPSWQTVLGYEQGELTSHPYMEFIHPEDHERTQRGLEQLRAGQEVRAFRNRYRAKDGQYHWLDWNARPYEDGRLFCVARDVTAHVELEAQIRQASLIDELTGLSNRRGFFLLGEQALRAAARHERPQLLCFLDLDGLKEINDQLGHDKGDQALADLGEVLKQVFRKSDIIARIGGDEFVTLAEGDSSAEPSLRQRIGDELRRHNESATRPYFLAASLGIACYNPRRPVSLSELLQQADRQMYERKRNARSMRPQQLA